MNKILNARTRIVMNHPANVLEQLCEHLVGHGAGHDRTGNLHELCFPFGLVRIEAEDSAVRVHVAGSDIGELHNLRSVIAGHMQEFAAEQLDIRWFGDGSELRTPPNFRILRVLEHHDLTPRMRRIRFGAEKLEGFAGLENIHVRLVFPPSQELLIPPTLGANGMEHWPQQGEARPQFRRYTIRSIDVLTGTLDIDFVLHDEASGPGSSFAENVRVGEEIGMIGPGGGSLPLDRDWYLIAGDETALPAIARFLEFLPDSACGHVIIEIAAPSERQELFPHGGFTVDWSERGSAFAAMVQECRPPDKAVQPFVWVGCEYENFRVLRRFVREDIQLPKGSHSIVSYWRKGQEGS